MRTTIIVILVLFAFPIIALADFSYLWCDKADDVYAELAPSGILNLYHDAAVYNCCPDGVAFDITTEGNVLRVEEQMLGDMPCDCDCCYNLSVSVANLTPGLWTVVYVWQDLETGGPMQVELAVSIAAADSIKTPIVVDEVLSDCVDTAPVSNGPEDLTVWGTLKGRYR